MSDDLVKRLRSKIIVHTDAAVWMMEAADRIEELEKQNASLEAKLNKLLAVSERALMLSLKYSHFKLHAMEPMHRAIAAVKIKGEQP